MGLPLTGSGTPGLGLDTEARDVVDERGGLDESKR